MKTKPPDIDSRERLVKATQELLWERGYVGTSPSAIQQKAGVGQGSMYHHFQGKHDLALEAIRRSAEELWLACDTSLSEPGSAYDHIAAYLHSERDVMRGCRIGRLTQDPEVVASEELRAPVNDTFVRLRDRLIAIIDKGRLAGEFDAGINAMNTAEMIVAVVQGGYVLSKAANDTESFSRAIAGVLGLLRTKTIQTGKKFNNPHLLE